MTTNAWHAVNELQTALNEARQLEASVNSQAKALARILVGRLRHVYDDDALAALKRELADYNIHTQRWKARS